MKKILNLAQRANPAFWLALAAAVLLVLAGFEALSLSRLSGFRQEGKQALNRLNEPPPKRDAVDPKTLSAFESKFFPQAAVQCNLFGIIGSKALFGQASSNAQPFEVGQTIPTGEKLLRIGVSEVVLEKDGKEITKTVFSEMQKPQPPPAQSPGAPEQPQGSVKTEVSAEPATGEAPDGEDAEDDDDDAPGEMPERVIDASKTEPVAPPMPMEE